MTRLRRIPENPDPLKNRTPTARRENAGNEEDAMVKFSRIGWIAIPFSLSCSQFHQVDYRDVEKTNCVSVKMNAGSSITGTVQQAEPHQLVVLGKNREAVTIQKSMIRNVRRKPPIKDDFGNGISEDEIAQVQTRRNMTVYGIGGGILSLGISFFAGSMIGNSSNNAGPAMGAVATGGMVLGTALFIHAGQNRDRQNAIRKIREMRRASENIPPTEGKGPGDVNRLLEEERKKQEDLRKERETLLKQLQESPEPH
jgi:hypothetical protein